MNAGKIASQAGHAYLNAYLRALQDSPDVAADYQRSGIGTKICLAAPTLDHLLRAHSLARERGLPCSLIVDEHHVMPPHFDGSPIVTALGIGPARRQDIHHITRKFPLVK